MPDALTMLAHDVGIRYSLEWRGRTTIKQAISQRLLGHRSDTSDEFWALRGISFEAREGDVIGVLGNNGAGKSTLFSTLAGLLRPDEGVVHTFGRAPTLLTVGAGFETDLTGRENVFISAAFLGISKRGITKRFDEIVEFSELGRFIDVPVRQYSTGMRARLGFSIVTHIEPEILLLDEVMGVGDISFRKKSERKLHELMETAVTIMIVSHSADFVTENCTKALWLDQGGLAAEGDPEEVVTRYVESTRNRVGPVRAVS